MTSILIADDSNAVRGLIHEIVADLAEDIYECSDGLEATELYRNHCPDWVLMDIEMPVLDGLSATRQIKQASPDAKVIIVSSYDDPRTRATAKKYGACGYVRKDSLFEIRSYIAQRTSGP